MIKIKYLKWNGMYCGVAGTGMLLLKVCDPESKADALTMYACRAPFCTWAIGGGIITSMASIWVSQLGAIPAGLIALGLTIVIGALPFVFRTWYKKEDSANAVTDK